MPADIFVNELSFSTPFIASQEADSKVADFLGIVRELKKVARGALYTGESILDTALASNHTFRASLNAQDRELKIIAKILFTSVPYLPVDALTEYEFQGSLAIGLGNAFANNGIAVSILSHNDWESSEMTVSQSRLHENTEIVLSDVLAKHASRLNHVQAHQIWIQQLELKQVHNADELWRRKAELWTRLDFCEAVERQLAKCENAIPAIAECLYKLERYCAHYTGGGFAPKEIGHPVSQESEATLQQYRDERTFILPDGASRTFSWHLKISHQALRIYFEFDKGRMWIGYIGTHLRTKKYP